MTTQFTSSSEAGTREIAATLARDLSPGAMLLLHGDLGAGKTAFVKGLAEGLGIPASDVTSPTFTLVHEYRGGRMALIHVDLYRLDAADLDELGVDPDMASTGVTAIEWPERLMTIPAGAIQIQIRDTGGNSRIIDITRP